MSKTDAHLPPTFRGRGRAKEVTLANSPEEQKAPAETAIEKKQRRAREGEKGWAEYEAARRAEADKTARLKALRLAKEESDRQAVQPTTAKKDRSRPGN
jgi:hypothetical protein